MDGFDREVLRRLPLAQASLSILGFVLSEPFLDAIFEEHRGRGYEGVLTFAALLYLVRDALLIHQGHGLPSFQRAAEAGDLPVLTGSVYPKLARIEPAVSKALLGESSRKMMGLFDHPHSPLPSSICGFEVLAFDGKTIKHVRRQLKALRPLRGKLLGGKLLVAQDVRSGLALAMDCSQDGERNDVPLVPEVVRQVRGLLPKPKLWMADRQFCDLNLMRLLTETQEHFLIRMTRTLRFTADSTRPEMRGLDAQKRSYQEQWGWVGGEKDPRRRYVRKITLYRSQEEGDDVILLTDLLDETLYPAGDLLETYLLRWGIEQMFQTVTEVFCLKQLIGCTPRANIFQASLCLVIYNAVQVMRSYAATAGKVTPPEVSASKLFDDVQEELVAHSKLGSAQVMIQSIQQIQSEADMKGLLKDLLASQWKDRWLKTPTNVRYTQGRTQRVRCGKTSVFKVLEQHRAKRSGRRTGGRQRC